MSALDADVFPCFDKRAIDRRCGGKICKLEAKRLDVYNNIVPLSCPLP